MGVGNGYAFTVGLQGAVVLTRKLVFNTDIMVAYGHHSNAVGCGSLLLLLLAVAGGTTLPPKEFFLEEDESRLRVL